MKSNDIIKLENILKNLKFETEREVNEIFENFNFTFTRKEKFLLTIPGLDILVIKKAEKRFYNNFKQKDINLIKENLSYLFKTKVNNNNFFLFLATSSFFCLSYFCLSYISEKDLGVLFLFGSFFLSIIFFSNYFFETLSENSGMKENVNKEFLSKKIINKKTKDKLDMILKKEDFEELKNNIDIERFKKLLVDNNFNISYGKLQKFIIDTKKELEKESEYLKAQEIFLSKESILL